MHSHPFEFYLKFAAQVDLVFEVLVIDLLVLVLVAIFFYIEDQNILISLACLLIAIFWISYDFLQK